MPPIAVIRAVVIVVVAVPSRAHAEFHPRPLEIDALRHARRRGSDRQRADEREGAKNLQQVPRHGSSPISWRSSPCCRMQPDVLGQRLPVGPSSRVMGNPSRDELNRFDGTIPRGLAAIYPGSVTLPAAATSSRDPLPLPPPACPHS